MAVNALEAALEIIWFDVIDEMKACKKCKWNREEYPDCKATDARDCPQVRYILEGVLLDERPR